MEATTTALASILTSVSVSSEAVCDIHVEVETSVSPGDQQEITDHDAHYPHDESPHHEHPEPAHRPDTTHSPKSPHGRKRPARNSEFKRKHGKVVNKQSAKHHVKHKPHQRRPVEGKGRKVLPRKQERRAARLAAAKKHAMAMRNEERRAAAKKRAMAMKQLSREEKLRAMRLAAARKRALAMKRQSDRDQSSRTRSPGRSRRSRGPRRSRSRGSRTPRRG